MLDTYNFEFLHCVLTHMHASRLLHLNQAQVLQRQKGENRIKADGLEQVFSKFLLLQVMAFLIHPA